MWLRCLLVCLLVPCTCAGLEAQQGKGKKKKKRSVFAPIKVNPKLPHVLLIGDSISIGYTLPVRKLLSGKANVHRIPTNGGPTIRGLQQIEKWLGKRKWDVIHFNWGLHDLKMDAKGKHQVPLKQYEKNLRKLVKILKGRAKVIIWASTTPVPKGKVRPPRKDADVVAYNAIAKKIMKDHNVAINDLYSFVLPKLTKLQRNANVHFNKAGSQALGRRVAAQIEKALQ